MCKALDHCWHAEEGGYSYVGAYYGHTNYRCCFCGQLYSQIYHEHHVTDPAHGPYYTTLERSYDPFPLGPCPNRIGTECEDPE